jgi:hypothetical protein
MSKKKPSLVDIKKNLDSSKPTIKIEKLNFKEQSENPQRGRRGDFKRLSLTLPKYMLDALRSISLERKIFEIPNYEMTSLIREALASFIEKESPKK